VTANCHLTEERAALRLFLRALRSLPAEADWHATVWSARPLGPQATLGRALRELRIRGLIKTDQSGITILDLDALIREAGKAI